MRLPRLLFFARNDTSIAFCNSRYLMDFLTSALIFFIFFFTIGIFLIFLIYILPIFLGAPFVSTSKERVEKMLELANPRANELLYDLGSGDGRIVIEAVKKYGVRAIGIELNPILVFLSRRRIKKLGLESQAEIYWGNFFGEKFSGADTIIMYLFQLTNNRLEKKFLQELKPGTKIVSQSFTFKKIPFLKSHPKEKSIRLYQIPDSSYLS